MADIITSDSSNEKVRAILSYLFSGGALIMLGYILYRWGDQKEILTLIIGLIGGTLLGSVSGVYFGGSSSPKKPDTTTPVTGDNTTVVNNPANGPVS